MRPLTHYRRNFIGHFHHLKIFNDMRTTGAGNDSIPASFEYDVVPRNHHSDTTIAATQARRQYYFLRLHPALQNFFHLKPPLYPGPLVMLVYRYDFSFKQICDEYFFRFPNLLVKRRDRKTASRYACRCQ